MNREIEKFKEALKKIQINNQKVEVPTPYTGDVVAELEKSHVGFKEEKEKFADYIKLYLETGGNFSPTREVICFVGAPGTGKTTFALALAKVMGREHKIIPCAGLKELNILGDKSDRPSMVGEVINEKECNNPIIILDELEKVEKGSQIQKDLIELFEKYKKGEKFLDQYYDGEEVSLDHITFIATVNYPEWLAPSLKEKLAMNYLKDYSDEEKEKILNNKAKQIEEDLQDIFGNKINFPTEIIKWLPKHIHGVGVRPAERVLIELKKRIVHGQIIDKSFTLSNSKQWLKDNVLAYQEKFSPQPKHYLLFGLWAISLILILVVVIKKVILRKKDSNESRTK